MQVYIHTFGCKVNCFESAAMAHILRHNGFDVVAAQAGADIIVINSCTVTANGDKKVGQYLRRIKRDNPAAIVVLAGCMPQAYPDKAASFPEADIITGTGSRQDIAALIQDYLRTRAQTVSIVPNAQKAFETLHADVIDGHTRAFLKIEDGCERYCAYCIVPYARGNVRSMPLATLREQVEQLAAHGYREVVLSGVNLSFYGKDLGVTLADAVACAAAVDGIVRVRLGSLEPDLLSGDALTALSKIDKLCPQFHLALQSGCDDTLRRMARHYDTAQFTAAANRIRKLFDAPTFTTDIMVGFPGETETAFQQSLAFVSSFGFLKCHVFPYSARPGTAAADYPDHLDNATKERRAAEMTAAAEQSREMILQSAIGQTVTVILEQPHNGGFSGYTAHYLPAVVYGENLRTGDMVSGVVREVTDKRICLHAESP